MRAKPTNLYNPHWRTKPLLSFSAPDRLGKRRLPWTSLQSNRKLLIYA